MDFLSPDESITRRSRAPGGRYGDRHRQGAPHFPSGRLVGCQSRIRSCHCDVQGVGTPHWL